MSYGEDGGWLAGKPAAVASAFGKGRITYIGATMDTDLTRAFVSKELEKSGVGSILRGLPSNVELMERSGLHGAKAWILINHAEIEQKADLGQEMTDLLTGKTESTADLPAHGVAVFLEAH